MTYAFAIFTLGAVLCAYALGRSIREELRKQKRLKEDAENLALAYAIMEEWKPKPPRRDPLGRFRPYNYGTFKIDGKN